MNARPLQRFGWIAPIAWLWACATGQTAVLEPIPAQTVAVSDTLVVPLVVRRGTASDFAFEFRGPEIPNLAETTSITGTAGGGEFRWTPLANQVGEHEFRFRLVADGEVIDEERAIITVVPAEDAAPVFLTPGAGGTYDLSRDPCVHFDAEVRDADSLNVEIRARAPLPEGASLTASEAKRASFDWCPTEAQVAMSERWPVQLEADDGEHTPTPHDYVIVLRTASKPNCPGTPPTVTLVTPASNARVTSEPGYTVTIEASDDGGLRSSPLLYYTTTTPDDTTNPDITEFEQLEFQAETGNRWTARIPSLGLAAGAEAAVYYLASATDNDDPNGSACDLTTDSELVKFTAVGANETADTCSPCTTSTECSSLVCAASSTQDRCVPTCSAAKPCAKGTCQQIITADGALVTGCGNVTQVCDPPATMCTDDNYEPNDSRAQAKTLGGSGINAQICPGNVDYFKVAATGNQRITVTLDGFQSAAGDLDLSLYDASGTLLDISDSFYNTETVSHCAMASQTLYAAVYGFQSAANAYRLRSTASTESCCTNDGLEPNNSMPLARTLSGSSLDSFAGTICPGDDDYFGFTVPSSTTIHAVIVFNDLMGDLDIELYDPNGTKIASSNGIDDEEEIVRAVTVGGRYVLRVFGFQGAQNDYLGMITLGGSAGCTSTDECAIGEVCSASTCKGDVCTSVSNCPADHGCVDLGPSGGTKRCAFECALNADCRGGEACKRLSAGRYCDATGSGQNGDACAKHSDCGGQRACLGYPGGYCARAGCSVNSDCESGTYCVAIDGTNVCAKGCASSTCRSGYTCSTKTDKGGALQSVCVP
ncbi:MAG: PPC domain-containing protein [Polyangiales bacterium]